MQAIALEGQTDGPAPMDTGPAVTGDGFEDGPVTVCELVDQAVQAVSPLAQELSREVTLDLAGEARLAGGGDLRQAFRRLLAGAMAHGAGPIRISTYAEQQSAVRTVVTDLSSGNLDLPDALRQSLARAICPHGGWITYISGPSGCRVRILFPVGAEAA